MSKTTNYPHQDLIIEKKIKVTELSAEAQKAIADFKAEKDEAKKKELDGVIYDAIMDYIEANPPADDKDDTKTKKDPKDVSKAPTAVNKKTGKDDKGGKGDGAGADDKKDDKTEKGPTIMGYGW